MLQICVDRVPIVLQEALRQQIVTQVVTAKAKNLALFQVYVLRDIIALGKQRDQIQTTELLALCVLWEIIVMRVLQLQRNVP
jgi:hypothetical protein